ncbi:MAG: hypothetical protein BWZ02_01911 [Lentisphaerae bacterium ADurb.BinA184]|nr:MAG: hypothetical protein BWZ02_01911 [Lentisphaerae bacterium ADurb.BinA184]
MLAFLVDESAGHCVADCLRAVGCDVQLVSEIIPQAEDEAIPALALREGRIVVTNDKDFGELVFRSGLGHAGVLLGGCDQPGARVTDAC